jgi:thiamine-monophosphate kinase
LDDRKLLSEIGRAHLIRGIGDDCAVLRPAIGSDLLVTTDLSLEGVHFRREWHPPESVGHRCLARGLSDIAAMGGEPIAAFLSLALPAKLPQSWVDKFLKGLLNLADQFGVTLAGGDTSQSPSRVLADIVVLGSAPKGRAILRSGASVGDLIYVTGTLGGSAAALGLLFSKKKIDPQKFPRHFAPVPRIQAAQILRAEKIPTSMIDLSDGLSTDLSHICEASAVGAEIWAGAIPRAKIGSPPKLVDLELALHGGEDYELLFTASPRKRVPKRIAAVPVTCIGEITRKKRIALVNENGSRSILKPKGWEHFRP